MSKGLEEIQEIYINLDDSGKLTRKEKVCIYGGLVFFSKKEKDRFITQYKSIISKIKRHYCDHTDSCDHRCPEIKNTNIESSHKRWLMNYIKRYYIIALVLKNDSVYDHIIENKAAKGRFTDYAIRRLIKEVVKDLISKKIVDPNKPLRLIINIDQQSTKNNGYYNLHDGLIEELKYGIVNYNYGKTIPPIVNNDLKIRLSYQDSGKSYVVQAADLLAGTIRRSIINAIDKNEDISQSISKLVHYVLILP